MTDAVTALPLSNVCVTAFVSLSGSAPDVAQDCSDASGAYDLCVQPSGSYRLMAVPPFGSSHVREVLRRHSLPGRWLRHRQRQSSCGRARGNDRRKGLLIGDRRRNSRYIAVTPATGRASIGGEIVVYSRAGTVVRTAGLMATVDYQTGDYVVNGLPAGTYYALTSLSGYRNEIFDDVRCQAQSVTEQELTTLGTPLSVAGGGTTSGIDFAVRNDLAPGVPQGLTAMVNGSTVTLSWGPPYQGGAPASYLLEAGASPGATFVQQPTADQRLVVTGVLPGRYFARVRAVNANGAGPASDDVLVTIAGAGSPPTTAPVNLVGWMSGPRLTLTWGAPPSAAGISARRPAGSATGLTDLACLGVNARALTFIPVAAGYYFVRVRAMNARGLGPASNEVLVNSGYVPAPAEAPSNIFIRVSGSTVTLA